MLIDQVKQLGNVLPTKNRDNPNQGRVYDSNGLSPVINTMQGGNLQPMIVAMRGREDGQQLESPKEVTNTLTSVQKDNLVIEPRVLCGLGDKKSNNGTQYFQQDRVYSSDGIAMCLPANIPGGSYKYMIETINTKGKRIDCASTILSGYERTNMTGFNADNGVMEKVEIKQAVESQYRIRKLTPKECWRLMGFTDEEFEKAAAVNSNTQLYKQAGNSIVVDVLVAIFKELLF